MQGAQASLSEQLRAAQSSRTGRLLCAHGDGGCKPEEHRVRAVRTRVIVLVCDGRLQFVLFRHAEPALGE